MRSIKAVLIRKRNFMLLHILDKEIGIMNWITNHKTGKDLLDWVDNFSGHLKRIERFRDDPIYGTKISMISLKWHSNNYDRIMTCFKSIFDQSRTNEEGL